MNTSNQLPPPAVGKPPLAKQTTVGNYFVSNYPPFAFWKPDLVPDFVADGRIVIGSVYCFGQK